MNVGERAGRYAVIKTDVSPRGAQVYLDGKYIGTADDFDGDPDFLYLGPGRYYLEFKLPNYQAYTAGLDVKAGEQLRIDEKLRPERGTGKSALDSSPPEGKGTPLGRVFTRGASGQAVPATPRGDDGWSDRELPVRERANEDRMDVRPESASRPSNRARLRFRVSPDDAVVYMDDRYLGAGDDLATYSRGVVAEPGTHMIVVARPGFKDKTVEVTARAGSAVDVVVDLQR